MSVLCVNLVMPSDGESSSATGWSSLTHTGAPRSTREAVVWSSSPLASTRGALRLFRRREPLGSRVERVALQRQSPNAMFSHSAWASIRGISPVCLAGGRH